MTLSLADALGPVIDALLMQYYFATAHDEKPVTAVRKALSILVLLSLILLAVRGIEIQTQLRFALRVLCYFLYLYGAKGILNLRGLFLAVYATSLSIASQNIFLSPLMGNLVRSWGFSEAALRLELLLSSAVRLLIILVLRGLLPLDHVGEPTMTSWLALGMTVVCIMLSWQLRWADERFYDVGGTMFALLQIFMLLFLVVLEREGYQSRLERESRLQSAVNRERLRMYESQYQADASIRSLRHDMKNHLLAIRSMAGKQDGRLNEYLDSLLQEAEEGAIIVETGRRTLDGLLSQKILTLSGAGIRFDVILNLRDVDFLSDMDLCTIFGNAVDNAIEACNRVDDPNERYISIHSESAAGQLIVCIKNAYNGEIHMKNGLPLTSKADPAWHGLGLSNIRKTARKYGGVVEIDLSVPKQFSLTVLLPLA